MFSCDAAHIMMLLMRNAFIYHFYLGDIMQTSPCNEYPLTSHFYVVKLGFTEVYIIFLFLFLNIDCGYSLVPPQ